MRHAYRVQIFTTKKSTTTGVTYCTLTIVGKYKYSETKLKSAVSKVLNRNTKEKQTKLIKVQRKVRKWRFQELGTLFL